MLIFVFASEIKKKSIKCFKAENMIFHVLISLQSDVRLKSFELLGGFASEGLESFHARYS